jgi:hypothetical protein
MRVTSRIRTRGFLVVFVVVCGLAIASAGAWAGGGGNVLPPNAKPHGYTLADLSFATALFTTSGNNLLYYPNTPFQVLYFDPATLQLAFPDGGLVESGTNQFTVDPGTPFYVPLWNADDSPPIAGTFPTNAKQAPAYWFDPSQLGAEGFEVIVDGASTPVGPAYVAGPVTTPPLFDGGGTHYTTIGVFLTPLTPGTHTVEIKGALAGAAIPPATGGLTFLAGDFVYTIHVVPHGR